MRPFPRTDGVFLRESLSGSLSDAEKKAILELQNAKGISADEICFAAQILGNFFLKRFPQLMCVEQEEVDCRESMRARSLPLFLPHLVFRWQNMEIGQVVVDLEVLIFSNRFIFRSIFLQNNLGNVLRVLELGSFAPRCYPEMAAFGAVRKTMGVPTMFNLLGPVLSPLNPEAQLVGVSQHKDMPLLLSACLGLGRKKVSVVHGSDGLDEVTMTGTTDVVSSGGTESVLTPEMFGVESVPFVDIQGGGKEENLAFAQEFLFEKQVNSPRANLVLLNTAMALSVFTESDDFPLFSTSKRGSSQRFCGSDIPKTSRKTGALLSSS